MTSEETTTTTLNPPPPPPQPETSKTLSHHLLQKCRRLLAELDAFQSLLHRRLRNPQVVEARQLRSNVAAELRTLERLRGRVVDITGTGGGSDAGAGGTTGTSSSSGSNSSVEDSTTTATATVTATATTTPAPATTTAATATAAAATTETGNGNEEADAEADARLLHTLRSSNLPFYESVWAVAKRSCTGLVAFGKRFYWDGDSVTDGKAESPIGCVGVVGKEDGSANGDGGRKQKKRPSKDKRKGVSVDIVADDGEEWVKVSTVSVMRILYEMAEKGWEGDAGEDEDEEEEESSKRTVLRNYAVDGEGPVEGEEEDEDELELIKLAKEMTRAASTTRVRYRHPRVRFVVPKVKEGEFAEIDRLLRVIRGLGVTVECGESTTRAPAHLDQQVAVEDLDLSHLLPNSFRRFTSTLNVDCTLLLALVSDLSHSKCLIPTPGLHKAIIRQMEIERQQPLLPAELWPAMNGYELVCTEEAAKRMREIVDVIGTDTERKRMRIMMGESPFENWDRDACLEEFQRLSNHQVPAQWRIPIRVIEAKPIIDAKWKQGDLPSVAEKVAGILSDINYSIFLYGWFSGLMTISSNRTVAKHIEATIEKHRNGDDSLEGPLIWVCDTARSLIGKERNRK